MTDQRPVTTGLAGELPELVGFLRESPAFAGLATTELEGAARHLSISYHRRGESFSKLSPAAGLRILRSGAVDICDDNGRLLDRLGEGDSFHIDGLNAERGKVTATVIEDSLIYLLADDTYRQLRASNRSFDRYFSGQRSRRLRRAARYEPQPHTLLREAHTVMSTHLLTASAAEPVIKVAQKMTARRVSSVLVVRGDCLLGIVTDRDLRVRHVAAGLAAETAVADIMTAAPESIDRSDSIFSAMLLMTQRNYHHLPVMEQGKLCGIVTTSDLMLARQEDPVYLVQHISRRDSVEGLKELVSAVPGLMTLWVNSGMRAQQVSRILTAISDAVTVRLLQLAEQKLGPPPVSYCWLGFGSQARAEQLLGADQDNGLVFSDEVQAQDLPWFAALARFVCAGLDSCGYSYCPGDVMASNPDWCQPLGKWLDYVQKWTASPTPNAVMRVSIFFDLRAIHGDSSLCSQLQQRMLEKASTNTIFLAALAENALAARPPLGIFRRFVVDRDGEHRDSLDLKKRGILLVTDTVRLHALAHRIKAVNTDERLAALAQQKYLTISDSRNQADALRVMQQLRIQHQADQVRRGDTPDNFLNPRDLPKMARQQLRDAFTILDDCQSALRQTYRQGMG